MGAVKTWEFLPGGWAENLTLSEVGLAYETGRAEPVRFGDDGGSRGAGFVSPDDLAGRAGAPLG